MFWNESPLRFVRATNPMRLNERLTLQQGIFLCPGDVTIPFEENLKMYGAKKNVHKIVITKNVQKEIFPRLRKMNIERTTLFPGLDGFAQSLNSRFVEIGQLPEVGFGL